MADQAVLKIILDFIIFLCVSFPVLYLRVYVEPQERGFFEADHSIRLPYRQGGTVAEEVADTIGFAAAGIGLIIVTVVILEVIEHRRSKTTVERTVAGVLIPGWLWESYSTFGIFWFGAALQQLNGDCIKYTVGRLRPYFHDLCRPVYNATSPINRLGYIQEYTCTAATPAELKDARLSFPSGHASFGMYTAVFFSGYLQLKWRWRGSKLLRHTVQFLAFLYVWYMSLTRVVQNIHHWDDIGFGFFHGAVYGFIIFNYVLKLKNNKLPKACEKPNPKNVLPRRP